MHKGRELPPKHSLRRFFFSSMPCCGIIFSMRIRVKKKNTGAFGRKLKDILYFLLLTISLALFSVSAAVAVPLLWRGFYYWQIKALHLVEKTPWSYEQIKAAYDEMMDFCMFGGPFGTGDLKWSIDGMRHFADCRVLFVFDIRLMVISLAVVIALLLYGRKGRVTELRPLGRGPFFWAGVTPAAVFGVLVMLIQAIGFDQAFVTFHHIFFPGKTNWVFEYDKDEIIYILPEEFFRNCAILIVAGILVLSIAMIVLDLSIGRKKKRENAGEL